MKITKKTAILFTAVLLISAVTAVMVFARPSVPGFGKERGYGTMFVEPLLMGHGFALNGDQYHILDISAKMGKAKMSTRAHLRFAGQAYALNITSHDNQSLSGDVLTLPPQGTNKTSFTPAAVGHISLSMSKYEGEMLSNGTLTMNGTDYKVLLTSPVRFKKW
ncbi:Uncharacterised protein [uncultured archaeon]|nr:Uncharacterised protein [uncultured archaeon]